MVTAAAAYVKAIEESGWLADTRCAHWFKIYRIIVMHHWHLQLYT